MSEPISPFIVPDNGVCPSCETQLPTDAKIVVVGDWGDHRGKHWWHCTSCEGEVTS